MALTSLTSLNSLNSLTSPFAKVELIKNGSVTEKSTCKIWSFKQESLTLHHKHGIQLNAGFNAAFNYNQCLSIFIQQSLGIRRKSFNQPQAYSTNPFNFF